MPPKPVRMELEGVRELTANLEQFTNAVAKNITSRALIKAAAPMVEAAKAGAPSDTGNLKDSITASNRLRQRTRKRKDQAFAYVGPSYSKSDQDYAPYAHLIEFGTAARYHKSGKFVGQTPANPFLRPAFDATAQKVILNFRDEFENEITKAAKRAERKARRKAIKAGR